MLHFSVLCWDYDLAFSWQKVSSAASHCSQTSVESASLSFGLRINPPKYIKKTVNLSLTCGIKQLFVIRHHRRHGFPAPPIMHKKCFVTTTMWLNCGQVLTCRHQWSFEELPSCIFLSPEVVPWMKHKGKRIPHVHKEINPKLSQHFRLGDLLSSWLYWPTNVG